MKTFQYTITDAVGIHARPAGLLVQTAKGLDSAITIEKVGGESAAATRLLSILGLCVNQGDVVSVTVEGGAEEANAAAMAQFFQENL